VNKMRSITLITVLIAIALITTLLYRVINPDWILFRKGEDYFSRKSYSEAIPCYVTLVNEGFVTPTLLKHLGTAYLATGDLKKSVKVFAEFLKRNPDTQSAVQEVANIYVTFGQFARAAVLYGRLVQNDPDNKTARILLARSLSWAGHLDEAILEYKKALGEEK